MKPPRLVGSICLAFGLSLMVCCQAGPSPSVVQPAYLKGRAILVSSRATILVGKAARLLFRPCSRDAPAHVSGYWTPSAADIRQLEADAPGFLKTQHSPVPGLMTRDHRQYAGFLRGGHRLIYVSGFPDYVLADSNSRASRAERRWWQYHAVVICDGGPDVYGMEYDPQTRQFAHLAFNNR